MDSCLTFLGLRVSWTWDLPKTVWGTLGAAGLGGGRLMGWVLGSAGSLQGADGTF